MRRFLIGVLVCACGGSDGAQGPAGPQGPEGPQGDAGTSVQPSIATVLPRTMVLGHDTDIVVIGSLTSFTGSETLDFGPGVTVSNVTAISTSALSAHVHVDKGAAIGARDLKVQSFVAAKVASVVPGMDLTVINGSPTQGGFVELKATDLDPAQLFNQPHFLGGPAFDLTPAATGVTEMDYVSIIAPMSPVGMSQTQLGNYGTGGTSLLPLYSFYSAPDAMNVLARPPTSLTLSTPVHQSLGTAYDSGSFKAQTTGTAQVLAFVATADSNPMCPFAAAWGTSGLVDSYLTDTFPAYTYCYMTATSVIIPSTSVETFFFTVGDMKFRGGSGFGYTVTAAEVPATVIAEQSSPHGQGMEQPLGAYSNPTIITGSLNGGDLDAYVFSAPLLGWPKVYNITVRSDIDNIEVGFPYDASQEATAYLMGPAITPGPAPTTQKHIVNYNYFYGGYKTLVVRSGSANGSRTPVGPYTISISG